MYDNIRKRYGLKSLRVEDVQVSAPGRQPRPASLTTASCPGQCGGGPLEVDDALEKELDQMVAQRQTEGTLIVNCPRSKPSSTKLMQSCMGGLTAKIRVEYDDGGSKT